MPEQKNRTSVKLYLYETHANKTFLDSFSAKSFDTFVLVTGDFSSEEKEVLDTLYQTASEEWPDKKILLVDASADINFYGMKEEIVSENRAKIQFTTEVLSKVLHLPEGAIIRGINFDDLNRGLITCHFVCQDPIPGVEPSREGEESPVYNNSIKTEETETPNED